MRTLVAGALLAFVLSGCTGADDPPDPDVDLSGRWELVRLVTDGSVTTFGHQAGGPVMTSTFGEQAISGCQVIDWHTEVDGSHVRFTDLEAGFMLSCPMESVDRLDETYDDLLRRVDHAERSRNRLVLTGDDLELTYVRLNRRGDLAGERPPAGWHASSRPTP